MKTTSAIITLSLLIGVASVASADDTSKDKAAQKEKATTGTKVEKQKASAKNDGKDEVLTGTYLKQRIRRSGMITDGSSQVLVLDRSHIERSGANTVSQVLNRYGAR